MTEPADPPPPAPPPARPARGSLDRARWLRTGRHLAMELLIVAVGVLIALVVQQWAETRSWRGRADRATAAIHAELADKYKWAVEWRVVEPCIQAQLDVLRGRVLASGARLDPAPTYAEPGFEQFVLRMPSRNFEEGSWQATIADGVAAYLDPALRQDIDRAYTKNRALAAANDKNDIAYQQLLSLARPLPLDPGVRFALVQALDELSGRVEFMGFLSGQFIGHLRDARMLPAPAVGRTALSASGTRAFCLAHGYPLAPVAAAERPIASE